MAGTVTNTSVVGPQPGKMGLAMDAIRRLVEDGALSRR